MVVFVGNNSINKMEKVNEIEQIIISNYLCIPKNDYLTLFEVKALYDFLTLKYVNMI